MCIDMILRVLLELLENASIQDKIYTQQARNSQLYFYVIYFYFCSQKICFFK